MARYIGDQFINADVIPDIERNLKELQDALRSQSFMSFLDEDEQRIVRNAEFFLGALLRTYLRLSNDAIRALELLDAAGVWTGADDSLFDRVDSLIRFGVQGAPKDVNDES